MDLFFVGEVPSIQKSNSAIRRCAMARPQSWPGGNSAAFPKSTILQLATKCPPNQSMRATSTGGPTPANGRALDRYVPTKHKIGVTLDIYSAKGDMHESQAHLDLFLGQAILESPMANSSLASYCTLPLRRRREDTLNNAFVKFRLSRVAEETIELNVSSLKLSGIAAAERRAAEKHEAETVPSASESFNSPRTINPMLHTVCRFSGVVAVRSLGFDPSSLVDVRTGGRRVTPESTAQITSHFKCVLGGYAG